MAEFEKNEKNRIRRLPKRGIYERESIYQILDEALICHIGFIEDNQPYVIPMNYARLGDTILLHGANSSRLMKATAAGIPVCVEVTIVDGLVLARAVFNHSVNYRSVVLFGKGQVIEGDEEKLAALEAITEHLIPGRWRETRRPNQKELNATSVVAIKIEQASAKLRSGPPVDDEADLGLPVWAGVLPMQEQPLEPVPDSLMNRKIPMPEYIGKYSRKQD